MLSPKQNSYSALNVREYFETHSIEETKELQRKMNFEIERKREELRMLVGERYRDLIDAADTIGIMKESSTSVFNKLSSLRQKLNSMPQRLNYSSYIHKRTFSQEDLTSAGELKLCLEIPRLVELLLEKSEVIPAMHLVLFFVKKLDPVNKPYKNSYVQLSGNLESGNKIKEMVITYCKDAFQNFSIAPKKFSDCLVVYQILMNTTSENALREILQKKINLCQMNLYNKDGDFSTNVSSTIILLNSLFIDPQDYNLSAKEAKKPQRMFENFSFSFTPKSAAEFSNEVINVEGPLRISKLTEIVFSNYVEPLKEILMGAYNHKLFFNSETSLNDMGKFRISCDFIHKGNCDGFMKLVLGASGKTFWSEVYQPVFSMKCDEIVASNLKKSFEYIQKDAFPRFQSLETKFDIVSYTWKNPGGNYFETQHEVKDEMRIMGLSPHLIEFLFEIDKKFEILWMDFQSLNDPLTKVSMSAQILMQFKSVFNEDLVKDSGLAVARFAFALASGELLPNLWKLEKNDASSLKEYFDSLSEKSWLVWRNSVLEKLNKDLCEFILSPEVISKIIPVAEDYIPVGENEETLKASVRVPVQICHLLYKIFFSLCLELIKAGQTIPKAERENFRIQVGQSVVQQYERVCLSEDKLKEDIMPQMAMQFIFDLKFLHWIHPKIEVEPLVKKLQEIIDPFDLDIVNPRLQLNIKRFLFENHLTLGLLFSEENQSFIAQNFKTKQNQSFPISNAPLASPLPLLPV